MSKPKEIFLPSLDREIGAVHPINQVKFELVKLLISFGFEVAEGPEIESEEYNFDMLISLQLTLLEKCMTPFMWTV